MDTSKVAPIKFIVINNPQEMKNPEIRLMVASHTSKSYSQKRPKPARVRRGAILHSFLSWRFGSVPSKQSLTNCHGTQVMVFRRRMVSEIERASKNVPV